MAIITLNNNSLVNADVGKILQVVSATDSTGRSTTSSTFVTLSNTLSVNITPSSTSSKIFIIANVGMHSSTATGNSILTIFRDSTNLGNGNNGIAQVYYEGGSDIASSQALSILDTPNTTSSITYQIYVRANSSNAFINIFGSTSSITAFEIGA